LTAIQSAGVSTVSVVQRRQRVDIGPFDSPFGPFVAGLRE